MMIHRLKTLIAAVLFLNLNPSFAELQQGFYVGGSIGLANFMDKESHTLSPETHQLGAPGFQGGGFFGYSLPCLSMLDLSLEFFADAMGLESSIIHQPYTYQQKQDYELGLRVLPEYTIMPMMSTHLILAYINGRFSIKDDGVYGTIDKSYNQNGFEVGLGFKSCLNEHFLLRLDAIYDLFAAQSKPGLGLSPDTIQSYTNTFSSFRGALSLVYNL